MNMAHAQSQEHLSKNPNYDLIAQSKNKSQLGRRMRKSERIMLTEAATHYRIVTPYRTAKGVIDLRWSKSDVGVQEVHG